MTNWSANACVNRIHDVDARFDWKDVDSSQFASRDKSFMLDLGSKGAGDVMIRVKKDSSVRIRPGTPRNVPTILRMIRGLAKYERLTRDVKATASRLRQHGFGRQPYFQTLICWQGPNAVGFALYFFTYSTFLTRPTLYLEDLFVLPDQRGKGAGKALLAALARIAVRRGCGRMEWAVLSWNTPAIRFYKRLGAGLRKEWILTRLTDVPLRRLARSGKAKWI
jgi:GNAT superfamily N-acetyltransferase